MMNKPTDEQIKEFWEWCGFVSCYKSVAPEETGVDYWMQPPDSEKTIPIPDIDLNNLFKYAVSKLRIYDTINFTRPMPELGKSEDLWIASIQGTPDDYDNPNVISNGSAETPALALFWAIWRIKNEKM